MHTIPLDRCQARSFFVASTRLSVSVSLYFYYWMFDTDYVRATDH